MDILAIIPARGGSKGVPRKNVKLLNGKPLVLYSIEAAKSCELLNRIILDSDDDEILAIGDYQGIETFKRPAELAEDHIPILPVIKNQIRCIWESNHYPELTVILQPTNPFRKAITILRTIQKLQNSDADCAVTISKVDQHPYRVRRIEGDLLKPVIEGVNPYGQRQELPEMYFYNGSVIVARTDILMEQKDFYGETIVGLLIDSIESFDIDSILEFEFADFIAKGLMKGEPHPY